MMWYQQFHSGTRAVSIALMKSHRCCDVVTQISCAPMPSISGTARFGNTPATRATLALMQRQEGLFVTGSAAYHEV